jgi:hemin transport system permease protein
MTLALAELRRTPGKFASVAGAIGFIVFLALVLAALSDGLYLGSTGAYRSSEADFFVFSAGSGAEISGSRIEPEQVEAVGRVDGVAEAGRLATFNANATSDGEELQIAVMGADPAAMPGTILDGRRPGTGELEVLVDEQLRRLGVEPGAVISFNDGPDVVVVGVAADAGFGFGTAWASFETFDQVRGAVRPELQREEGIAQSIAVVTTGRDPVATAAEIGQIDGLMVASTQEAIDALPAASQQKSTLDAIVYTTFVVAAIVVGLFFALVTLEKRTQYAVLKAVGMSSRTLVAAIFAQALIASAAGFVIGLALSLVASLIIPANVPALFLGSTALFLAGVTLVMGALGALFSFGRVIRIDPASALGGAA